MGAIVVYSVGFLNEKLSKALTLAISAATLVATFYIFLVFNWTIPGCQFVESYNWASSLGLTYTVCVDGISLPLLIVSSFLTTLSAATSWNQIRTSVKEYNGLLLLFEGGIFGIFTSMNLALFFVFYEFVLIFMFFLVGVWGGPRRKYAAMKLLIMTHVGSVLVLLSFIALYVLSSPHTFDFNQLLNLHLPLVFQILISVSLLVGFGVKLRLVPLHTWVPDAYVEAPTAVSILLVGVLGNVGGYGFIRMNLFLLPEASKLLAPLFMGIGLLTMFYGAMAATPQQDFKRLVAFTSISQSGYVLLGAFTLTKSGITGAVFQMFNEAIALGALFVISGIIQMRVGTRDLRDLSGLAGAMPKTCFLLILASLAAIGFPTLSNFISEYMILFAAISVNMLYAIAVAVLGMTGGYFILMIKNVMKFTGNPVRLNEASYFTLLTAAAFLIPLFILGVYPAPLLAVITPTVQRIPSLGS
jgi:proton-translocating NADH-quinone oxidoreductase chain M